MPLPSETLEIHEILEQTEFSAAGIAVAEEIDAARRAQEGTQHSFLRGLSGQAVAPHVEDESESSESTESYVARFSDFINRLNLRFFAPHEFLFLGASNESGACRGRNHFPPEELWRVLVPTARFADALRGRLGSPVTILSGFRSDAYNRCIGGAGESRHRMFNALDLAPRGASVGALWQAARAIRAETPGFAGGIGKYRSFVHIDTRGQNVDWVG